MSGNSTPEQEQQEGNLDYVARTRAKHELVYMTNEKFLKYNTMPNYAQEDFEDKVWDAPVLPAPEVVAIEAVTPEPVAVTTPIESTETFPSFHTAMSEVLGSIGTSHVLYATNDEHKMCVSYTAKWDSFIVKSIAPDGSESNEIVTSRNDTLQMMKEFQSQATHWKFLSLDEWETIYVPPAPEPVVDTVFKPDGLFVQAFTPETAYDKIVAEEKSNWDADTEPIVDAITTPDDPYGQFQITVTALLALLPNSKGLFAVDGDTKLYVAPHISKMGMFFLETVNGEYTQETVTLTEALDKMYAFSPIPFTWNTISANDWMFATAQHKTMKERKAEAQSTPLVPTPRPFASIMKQHLTELLTTYDPDRGLCADGESTTMYITTDLEDVFVMYERDYADEDDMLWSRDSKEKNTELVLKKMQAINPNPDAWRMGKWSDWTDAVHDEAESDDMTFDEQPSIPTPLATESPVIIDVSANESELAIIPDTPLVEASTEQPVVDKPQTPSADALLMDMLVEAMHTSDGKFGNRKLTEIAHQLHLAIRSALPEMDWTDTIRARVKVAAKRIMRQHSYPPKNTYPPESIDSVADAICHIYEHGALPVRPVIPVDENSPYQVWKREQEARDAAKLIAKTKETGEAVDVQLGLSADDTPESTDTPIEVAQPLVSVPPVVDPVPDETPTDTAPTFSNGENPPSYQNGKDKSHTPAPLPSTAPNLLKVLIEEFRAFELPELEVALEAIAYVKREKTEGAGV
ncbi:MAG: hypothetical protein SFZ02_19845 [bacterium]|nr:hypothetical protein [bacterium]